ncbi:hypothetical protein K8R03_00960, partial [Candidatus Kaiserbacteria bacterium]|nr:hypothetical protein [Candidatus Kaiserbacteria bacterium]
MSDEIFFDGVRYVSAADAAADSGFTRDYVARLCRDGKVKGKRVGKNWYVDKSSLTGFVLSQEHAKGLRRESLAETRSKEYQKLHEIRNPAPREFAAPALHPVLDIRRNAHTSASRPPVRTIADVVPPHTSTTPAVTQHVRLMRQKLGTVASRHHAAVAGASRVLSSHAGLTDATIRAAHIPVYTVTPFAEFMHKLVALTLACMMTFGTYALVDPQYARFALESAAGTVRGISDTYETATHGGIGNLSDATQASIKVVVENPKASLASAASVFPHALASLAQLVNAKVDRMVYAVAFPEDLIQRGLNTAGASSGQGRVAVTIQPYLSRGGGTGSGPVTEHASSSEIANGPSGTTTIVNNPVTERIVERIVQTPTVAQAGGITEEYLDSRLNDLESRLSSRVYASASANSTAISQNYNVISQTNAVNNLDHATIQNSSITGGSISGASVAATALSVSGDSNLHGTSVSGDLTVSGAISLSGATSSITADGAVFTNATTTNATTTNFAATGLSSLATTTFTGDITLGGSLLFSGSSSTISAIGATFTNATSTNFFATNASTTNATSTNLFATNASTTNATSTNLFSTIGRFASAFIDSLTSYQSVTAPSFSATSTTATSTFAGGLLATRAPTVPHTFASWAIGAADANPFDASFVINPASAAGDSNLLAAAVGGSVKFLVDAEGDVFVNNLTSVGSVTLSTTTASSFTVEGDAVFGDSISDVTTVNGSLVVTGTTTASTIQGNFGIGTTTPWGRLSIAGAAGGTAPLLAISSSTSAYATSTVFYIDSNGWVGVGTTTPSAKFAVDAPIYIGGQGAAATSTIEGNLHIYGLLKVGTSSSYVSNSNISTIGDLSVTGTTNLSGLLTLATASTSQLSVYNKAYFGATATSTFDSAGNLSVAGTLSLPTLTQGSIPFIGASGVVSEDNDRLFFDSSLHSLRLGGASHTLTGANAAIIGGYFNTASGQYTFIGGGQNNQAQNVYDAVIGGNSNNVNAGNSFIAGGTNNTLTGASAGIVGGYYNTASGQYTFLGGGQNNQASDVYAAIVGGASNQATHGYSFIGGGYSNTANAAYALLGGGQQNTVNGDSSAIAGGYGNTANGLYSFLGGGQNNQTNDVYDAVVGGNTNVANGGNAFIGAGTNNTATGDKSGTLAGYFSTASGETSVVLGGQAGTASGVQSAVLGGYNGRASGVSSIVLGGSNNSATNTSAVALGNASNAGGVNSFASGDTNSAYAQDSFIAGGWNNIVIGDFGFLAGGVNNIVSGDSAAILGGINNLASGNYTSIIGGNTNNATNTNAVVLGGTSNNAGGISAIAGGSGNSAFGDYSFAFGRNTTVNGLGSVGFGLDSGTYAVNSNNVFAILGGNLGVGTTSPLAKLSVAGDTYLGGNVTATGTVTTALGAGAVFSNASGVLSAGTLSILNGGTNATSQTTNGVNYFDGTKITSGSTFTFNGTDIGIPGNIVSSASSLATYGFSNTAGSGVFGGFTGSTIVGSYLQLFGNTGGSGTTPAGGGEFVIDARNGATKFNILSYNGSYDSIFTLTSAGKVGIGNNLSPTYNLDVIGNGKFSSLVDADHFVATSSSVASIFNGGFLSSASSTLGNGTQTGGLTVNGGATTTGNAYFAGIIGVGTKAPQTALDVVGNAYVRNATGIVGSNDGVEIATDSSAPRVSLVQGGRYVGLFSGDAPGNTYLKNVAGGALEFFGGSGGNQELARLTNDGNLGIGTTSPWKMLSVAGDIIGTNLTATGTLQVAGAATLSSTLNVTGNTTLANATTTSIFSTTASSTNLYSTNANLGVLSAGTLSLVSTLNVTGLSTLAGFISTASSTIGDGTQTGGLTVSGGATTTAAQYIGGGLTVNSSASSYFRGTGDLYVGNGALWTGLGGAPDLSVEGYINTDAGINTAGDVKIGHDATLWTALGGYADLAVAGWINANSGVNTAQGSASSPGFNFYSTNNTGIFATAANASAGIGFSTQGVERARIDNAGNLG